MNRTREQIISMLIEHSRVLHSVISDMGVYYSMWAEDFSKNKDDLVKKKAKMELSEEDADTIKIRMIQDFSEAGAQGLGDYIALILRMDNVINSALEFCDILSYLVDCNLSEDMKKQYRKLINYIIEMSTNLKITIKNLRDNLQEVFGNTTKIHEIENKVDGIFREFLSELYDNKELDIRLLLRIRDSIIVLENLADRIHDIADNIRVLIYQ
ncbi:MAG: DUF47 family protein [Candidatus Lokiarchaeota archaeon]|nr:DUF47 family protein [Candidatus Lokiarchaeota archaeon]MBD3338228.1 DUF47 family protein [Candidatus Lokiarchaeota archaeon]